MTIDFFAPGQRGLQHASLRAANRRAVLTTIARQVGSSNAEVSRLTGLAPQTASAIVAELEADGIVIRGEVLRGRRGQPATPLFINPEGAYSIGCEIGWRHIEMLLLNLGGAIIAHHRRDYAYPDATTIVSEVASVAGDFVERLSADDRQKLIGIGIASPSAIDRGIAQLDPPPEQIAHWAALDLRAEIETATGMTSLWFNDGNAACWAEVYYYPPPRPASFTYLFVSTFLGAGVVAEHTLWEGSTGNSANLGAMLVPGPDGKLQFGYRLASVLALERHLAAAGIPAPVGNPADWPWVEWEPQVSEWILEAAGALAKIVVNTVAVFEFDTAVIDGALPRPILLRLVEETRRQLTALPTAPNNPAILLGHAGNLAPSVGASMLPLYRKFFSREPEHMLA